jgi:tetratricopeptide (TPR) repeat protein
VRSIIVTVFLLITTLALAQSDDAAKRVYQSSENSVFLVYLNDSNGTPTALGSAFVVGPRMLITNAHVVDAGEPVLAIGPVRIPVKVLKKDEKNDLALISVSVDLTSTSLPLAKDAVTPGEQIFAIGNPEGLEKTISQGIVSGLRTHDDRSLLQITSPISHGSSGGPILDAKGQVVGVAVGLMEDGQNLNFAVPVRYVQLLLDAPISPIATLHTVSEVATLATKKRSEEYSDDENSAYQQDMKHLDDIMPSALKSATTSPDLSTLACIGADESFNLSDTSIEAARKLQREYPSSESRTLLSYVLYRRSTREFGVALFAKDSSPEKAAALTQQENFLSEAESEAKRAIDEAKGKRLPIATFVMANIKEDRKDYAAAVSLFQQVVLTKPAICGTDLTYASLRSLITDSDNLGKNADAELWFRRFASDYAPSPYDWDSEGDRGAKVKDYAVTADAYERAASDGTFPADSCYAAINRWLEPQTDGDRILDDGRACVTASIKNSDKNKEVEYRDKLPIVYEAMADVLNGRGVYQPALQYAKEAVAGDPDNAFALNIEAAIFDNLERYTECIGAAQAAITASDGKYPSMHFRLGSCYFSTENWSMAATNYRIAAEANPMDAVSAFDLGLTFQREGYGADARQWFSEALKRKPDAELRAKILSALSQ